MKRFIFPKTALKGGTAIASKSRPNMDDNSCAKKKKLRRVEPVPEDDDEEEDDNEVRNVHFTDSLS